MYDASGELHNMHDKPLRGTSPLITPLLNATRGLCRTNSYASIDTILPTNGKGVRRCITEIAESLKQKYTRKRKQNPCEEDDPNHDRPSNSKARLKGDKHQRKFTALLRDQHHLPGNAVCTANQLYGDVLSEGHIPPMHLLRNSDPVFGHHIPKEDDRFPEKCFHVKSLSPKTTRATIKDVKLDVRPSTSDLTIWDGLYDAYHLFQCCVLLQCTAYPYNSICIPDIRHFEMDCYTHPPRPFRYIRSPVLQASYKATSLQWASGKPNVDLTKGVRMDGIWRMFRNADGTWGWYKNAFVPFSPRLFDKMDYREFKLVSRLWVEESCIESDSRFGISMLLRDVDMK